MQRSGYSGRITAVGLQRSTSRAYENRCDAESGESVSAEKMPEHTVFDEAIR